MDEHAWSGKGHSHFPKLSLWYWSSQFAVLQYLSIKSGFQPLRTCSYLKTQLQLAWCGWCCVSVECWLVDKWARAENRGTAQFRKSKKSTDSGCSGHCCFNTQFHFSHASIFLWLSIQGLQWGWSRYRARRRHTLDGVQICCRNYTYNHPDLWMVRITSKPNTKHVSRLWGKQTQHRKASDLFLNPRPSYHCPVFALYVVVRLFFFIGKFIHLLHYLISILSFCSLHPGSCWHVWVLKLFSQWLNSKPALEKETEMHRRTRWYWTGQSSKQDDVSLHYICVLLCLSKLPPRS